MRQGRTPLFERLAHGFMRDGVDDRELDDARGEQPQRPASETGGGSVQASAAISRFWAVESLCGTDGGA
ncbi:MAG: hypothetical protein ACR2OU_12705 [Thermomicrobiales bacterium]